MDDEIRAYVDRVVAQAPPLTEEQASRIARLLRPHFFGEAPLYHQTHNATER